MGYEFYPQALENVIRKVSSELNLPIIVTENGVATDNDKDRVTFIEEALSGVTRCVADGIPVIGYMHWSLLDNFEWQLGYSKTFGLIEVDRKTQTRKPKESFYKLAEIWEKEIERQNNYAKN
jgi:beta-glucosidase